MNESKLQQTEAIQFGWIHSMIAAWLGISKLELNVAKEDFPHLFIAA